jgi:ubiquinone/menaquinone biosynthesis C-methylase UbiE
MQSPLRSAFQSPSMSSALVRRQTERVQFLKPERLLEVLGIHEGMKILDFGTGSGQYAYLFAEAMKGTGMIYASDIASEQIQYIQQTIKQRGFKNIQPILADASKFDPFYEGIKVDLIFMAHAYFYLNDQKQYVTRLKASLNPNGRFALLGYKWIDGRFMPRFSPNGSRVSLDFFRTEDITNVFGLAKFLEQNSFKKAIASLFNPKIHREITFLQKGHSVKKVKAMITSDFNRMLNNDLLADAFFNERGDLDPALNLSPDERRFAEWGRRFLKDEIPFLEQNTKLKLSEMFKSYINGLLIVGQFRSFLFDGQGLFTAWAKMPSAVFTKKLLLKSGYQFEGEYDFLPFETLLLFSLPQSKERRAIAAQWKSLQKIRQI